MHMYICVDVYIGFWGLHRIAHLMEDPPRNGEAEALVSKAYPEPQILNPEP